MRRRLAVGSVLSAAVLGGGVVAHSLVSSQPSESATATGSSTPAASNSGAATTVTEAQWRDTIRATIEETLPARFTAVVDAAEPRGPQHFEVVGDEGFWFNVRVTGQRVVDRSPWDCKMLELGGSACTSVVSDGWRVTAGHDRTDEGTETATLIVVKDEQMAELNLFTNDRRPVPVSNDELIAIGESPAFLQLIDIGSDYEASQPPGADPAGAATTGTPTAAPPPSGP